MVSSLSPSRRPMVTIERITALLIALLLGVFLLGFLPPFVASFGYLVLVLVTIVVVRSVPVEPGAWLGLPDWCFRSAMWPPQTVIGGWLMLFTAVQRSAFFSSSSSSPPW